MCEQPMCIQPQYNSSFQQSAQNVMRQVITQNTKGTSAQLCAPDKTYAMGVESLAILQASFGTDVLFQTYQNTAQATKSVKSSKSRNKNQKCYR